MKQLSLFALMAISLAACGDNQPTPEDFNAIEKEIQTLSNNGAAVSVVAVGPVGDYVLSLPATEVLTKIASKNATVTFLSVENPTQYAADDVCLLNIIPENTMASMNTPENKCNFRLFCGNAENINAEAYAVEVCSE